MNSRPRNAILGGLCAALFCGCNYVYTVNVTTRTGDQLIQFEDRRDAEFHICYHKGDYYFSHYHEGQWRFVDHCCRGAMWFEVVGRAKAKDKIKLN